MPKGPQGQKRPADVIGNAVHVMRIATGEVEEDVKTPSKRAMTAAEMGKKGGEARADKLSKRKLKEIARAAAKARWTNRK